MMHKDFFIRNIPQGSLCAAVWFLNNKQKKFGGTDRAYGRRTFISCCRRYDVRSLCCCGGLSLLASSSPDGLEWSLFGNEEAGYSANMGLDEEQYGTQSAAAEKAAAVPRGCAGIVKLALPGCIQYNGSVRKKERNKRIQKGLCNLWIVQN